MLQAVADAFELRESTLSRSALRRLTLLAVGSLPIAFYMPLTISGRALTMSPAQVSATKLVMTASLVCLVWFALHRVVNRFFFADRYLDEWEIGIKRRSTAFGFQVFMWSGAARMIAAAVLGDRHAWLDAPARMGDVFGVVVALFFLGMYAQVFHVLANLSPIDDDDMARNGTAKRRLGLTMGLTALALLLSGAAVGQSIATDGRLDAVRQACEARDSRVKRVEIDWFRVASAECADGSDPRRPTAPAG